MHRPRPCALHGVLLLAFVVGAALSAPEIIAQDAGPAEIAEAKPRFDVWEYRIEGNTVLDTKSLQAAVYPYLGAEKTIDDVEAAREALERLYRDSGFATVLVDIPEQQVQGGVVRLQVIEGAVGRLRVSGSRYFSLDRLKKQVPALNEGQVPYMPAVQEQLADLNRMSPDRQITPVLRPGRTPGTVEVELKVRDEFPLHGAVEVNNRNSLNTTRPRVIGSIRYDNLWQREHSASLQYQVSPEEPDEVQVLSGTYVFKPGGATARDVLAIYGVLSDSDVATAGDLTVLGKGRIVGARYIRPMQPLGNLFHSITFGFDYKDFDEDVRLDEGGTVTTPIDYCNWSADYKGTLNAPRDQSNFGVAANFGIRGVCNDEEEFELKRFNARPNYFFVTGFYNYRRPFAERWEFYGATDLQLANEPLVSNEQFFAGGARSVRGYYESQILGDRGLRGSVEIRNRPVSKLPGYLLDLYVLAFLDAAAVEIVDPLPDQQDSFDIAGWGIGIRLVGKQRLTLDLDIAQALEDAVDVEAGDVRTHLRLEFAF